MSHLSQKQVCRSRINRPVSLKLPDLVQFLGNLCRPQLLKKSRIVGD